MQGSVMRRMLMRPQPAPMTGSEAPITCLMS